MSPLLCEVCLTQQAIGVCASGLAPISQALCVDCHLAGAEQYNTCVYIAASAGKEETLSGVDEIIAVSLARCGKTREQFDLDVQNTLKAWEQMFDESGP